MIIDTTFAIDLMRNDLKAVQKLDQLSKSGQLLLIPSVVIFELYIGLGKLDLDENEKRKIQDTLNSFSILQFTEHHAQLGGIQLGKLYQKGNPVDPVDAQIAGIALYLQTSVLTRNKNHFERFDNLNVESY